jgi:hypothetical protein
MAVRVPWPSLFELRTHPEGQCDRGRTHGGMGLNSVSSGVPTAEHDTGPPNSRHAKTMPRVSTDLKDVRSWAMLAQAGQSQTR